MSPLPCPMSTVLGVPLLSAVQAPMGSLHPVTPAPSCCHQRGLANRTKGHAVYLLNVFTRLYHFWDKCQTFVMADKSLPNLALVNLLRYTSCLIPKCIRCSNQTLLTAVQAACAFSSLPIFASAVPITSNGLLSCPDPSLPGKYLKTA